MLENNFAMIGAEYAGEEYMVHVSFGGNDEVTLDMCVVPVDYDLVDTHMSRWDEVVVKDGETVKTENCIHIISCTNPENDKRVQVHYGGWSISGKWDTMEQVEPCVFVYHCQNDLFLFDITFSRKRYPWDGNYESLLHE